MDSTHAPAAQPSPALAEFLVRVRSVNPFTDNRASGPAPGDVDVTTLQQAPFQRLVSLAGVALTTGRSLGAAARVQDGRGKRHVLARLGRWAGQNDSLCVYVHNLQASPANLPRALLRATVAALTAGQHARYSSTPLFALVRD